MAGLAARDDAKRGERATAAGREHNIDELMARRWMVGWLRLLPILGGLLVACELVLAWFEISD